MKKTRGFWILLVSVLLVVCFSITVFAAGEVTKRKVRVGFFEAEGYHIMDKNDAMRGYGFDFLQMLLRYNDWEYEYIGYEKNWSDMPQMLLDKKIDLFTLTNKTPEREEKFAFSQEPIGSSSTMITTGDKNTTISVGDYKTYEGARVGLVTNSIHNQYFDKYAKEKGFTYRPVYYRSVDKLVYDVMDGKNIDMAVTSNMRILEHVIVLDEINPQPYYAVVRKEDKELLKELNYGIKQLNTYSPEWKKSLFQKYYGNIYSNVLPLTVSERNFLQEFAASGQVLTAAMNPELKPYAYFENGEAKGIIPTLFKKITEQVGVKYKILESKDRWEYKKQLNSGDAMLDLTAYLDYSLAEQHKLTETDGYVTTSLAMLYRKNSNRDPKTMTIAAPEEPTEYIGYNKEVLQNRKVKYYKSIPECIEAVRKGNADVTFAYAYMAELAVAEDYTHTLQYNVMPNHPLKLAIGINNKLDHRFLAVLNKGVNALPEDLVRGTIVTETSNIKRRESPLSFVYDNPMIALLILTAILGLGFMGVYQRNKAKRAEVDAQHERELKETEEKNKEALSDALLAAKSASEAKGQFLSKMSHEIRTPLNAIIGYMDIAGDAGSDKEKVNHCIENTQKASKHLLNIINDVLDISAIESGRMKIATEEFDLKEQLTTISTIFYNQADEKNIKFQTVLDGLTEEWVYGDQLRVSQILMNLLSNALKFTPAEGQITFKIIQQKLEEKTVFMNFQVSDTGIGMSEEYMKKLYTPFEQEDTTTARRYGGSGLGLSITFNLVKMMGGSIEVKSIQGKGTTFNVSLSFKRSFTAHSEDISQRDYSKIRALVVDDDKEACDYVKALLKRCKVKCDTVNDGASAIKQIKRRMSGSYKYDLVLIDWRMPDMDGLATAEKIKAECDASLPVIIVTAYDITEIADRAKAAGVTKVIAKPLFQSTMFDLLVSTYGKYVPKKQENVDLKDLAGTKVLLAEDNEMNMEIAVELLRKAGFIVTSVINGREALDTFTAEPAGTFDVILMDIQMPVMDGYEATRKIRSGNHPEAKTIPIIATTANAFVEDVNEALASGMNGHISKPINYAKLYEAISKFCHKKDEEDKEDKENEDKEIKKDEQKEEKTE